MKHSGIVGTPDWIKYVDAGVSISEKALQIIAHAGGVPEVKPDPQPIQQEDKPVAPFLVAAIPSLIQALPEFAKIFSKPDVAERNTEAVVKGA